MIYLPYLSWSNEDDFFSFSGLEDQHPRTVNWSCPPDPTWPLLSIRHPSKCHGRRKFPIWWLRIQYFSRCGRGFLQGRVWVKECYQRVIWKHCKKFNHWRERQAVSIRIEYINLREEENWLDKLWMEQNKSSSYLPLCYLIEELMDRPFSIVCKISLRRLSNPMSVLK